MNKIDDTCALCESKNCFIQKLSQEWLSWVDSKKYTVHFPKDQNIFWENAEVNGVHFIKNGKVKVFSSGLGNKEKIVRLASDGHIIGHRGYGAEKYPVSAATLAESLVCFIDNASLYELFMTNPLFSYSMMMFYSEELRKSEQRAKYNSQMTSKERIITAILYAKETFGCTQIDEHTHMLNVYLTRSEIASIADTTAEEVSRVLTILENKKLILKKGRNIQLLNEQKLLDMIKDYGIYNYTDSRSENLKVS